METKKLNNYNTMKNGTIIIPSNKEKLTIKDIIFRSKDGISELSFSEWFEEQDIQIIIRDKVVNED